MSVHDDFEAEMDADTLARAAEIRKDSSRVDRAVKAAEARAVKAKAEAEAMTQSLSVTSVMSQGFTKL